MCGRLCVNDKMESHNEQQIKAVQYQTYLFEARTNKSTK